MIQARSSPASGLVRSEKITPRHVERLAVVYVRQSTLHQVREHPESTRLQYGLVSQAVAWGWPAERVLVIDEDLGKSGASAEGRSGFQRLVSEVSLGHVGLILGVEMSRLARSSKDWHQLLELCALFGVPIADLDGIYDPAEYNDRLLLGLKGTMSEAELHLLRQRMLRGKLNKARRGALGVRPPMGYVLGGAGEILLDPDEQVQQVVRLIFRKFEELGTVAAVLRYLVQQGIEIGTRVRERGHKVGALEWKRPNRTMVHTVLKHPLYAGAYVFGRRQVDRRRKQAGHPGAGRVFCAPEQWHALYRDHVPAYISWEQYERNRARLKANRSIAAERRAVRGGSALLSGLVICAKCGCRMRIRYAGRGRTHAYLCNTQELHYAQPPCQRVSGPALDDYVSQWLLQALEPAALELSLEAAQHLERERADLLRLWKARRERVAYEAERAGRQYYRVEPENRLVARQLEGAWEEKLRAQQTLEEDYHRFLQEQPLQLSAAQRGAIRKLAQDVPALWEAESTTMAERKEILRELIEEVRVEVEGQSERVRVRITWVGGHCSTGEMARSVMRWEQLSDFPALSARLRHLVQEGHDAKRIAERLNAEGYRTTGRSREIRPDGVCALVRKLGLRESPVRPRSREGLEADEWWLRDLARELEMPVATLHNWIRRSWVRAQQSETGSRQRPWRVWADAEELERLRGLRARPARYYARRRWIEADPMPEGAKA